MREKHGKRHAPIYAIWCSMRSRCLNPNSTRYKDYGGRGICLCDRWLSFSSFYEDMGDPPEGMSLDRIDNDGPYSPENCRWATRQEQGRNRRSVKKVEAFGKTLSLVEWSEESGLPLGLIWSRLKLGWTPEMAVSHPIVRTHENSRAGVPIYEFRGSDHGVIFKEQA